MKRQGVLGYILCLILCILICISGIFTLYLTQIKNSQKLDSLPLDICQTGSIQVRVYDSETNNLINNSIVKVWQGAIQIGSEIRTINGFANITGLSGGWYNVTVEHFAYIGQLKSTNIYGDGDIDYLSFHIESLPAGHGFIEIYAKNETGIELLNNTFVEIRNNTSIVKIGYTDENGLFNATELEIGWFYITVTKSGYRTQSKSEFLHWNGDNSSLSFNMTANPADSGFIEVTVYDENNYGLPHAYISVKNHSSNAELITGYTDAYGFFNATGFDVGWYTVTASKEGYYSDSRENYINQIYDEDLLTFFITQLPDNTSSIEIYVIDQGANPILNAYAYIINLETGLEHSAGFTDDTGLYRASNCEKETWYQVNILKEGYMQRSKSVNIDVNGKLIFTNFSMQTIDQDAQSLKINVRNSINHLVPITNAVINIYQDGCVADAGSVGNWGHFTTYNVHNQTEVEIRVSAPGYEKNTSTVNLLSFPFLNAEFTVYLSPLINVTGNIQLTVRDFFNNSHLIANASVNIVFPNGSIQFIGETQANGFYNITNLEVGWYTIMVEKINYFSEMKTNLVNCFGDNDPLTFYLTRVSFVSQTLNLHSITPNPDPSGDLELHWNDITDELGYKVYRGRSPGELELIATLGADVTYFNDLGIQLEDADSNRSLYYQIVAFNENATVGSSIVSVTIFEFNVTIDGFELLFVIIIFSLFLIIVRGVKPSGRFFSKTSKIYEA